MKIVAPPVVMYQEFLEGRPFQYKSARYKWHPEGLLRSANSVKVEAEHRHYCC